MHIGCIMAINIFENVQIIFSKFSGQFINILTQALYMQATAYIAYLMKY
jgi:hypothetical protein